MIGHTERTLVNHVAHLSYQDLARKLILLVESRHAAGCVCPSALDQDAAALRRAGRTSGLFQFRPFQPCW